MPCPGYEPSTLVYWKLPLTWVRKNRLSVTRWFIENLPFSAMKIFPKGYKFVQVGRKFHLTQKTLNTYYR